jgi:hypothetical protein
MLDLNTKSVAAHSPHTLLLEPKNNLKNNGFSVVLMFEVFMSLLGIILVGSVDNIINITNKIINDELNI